ncbi:MAG: flagellar assembly protein FliH [Treponema sp.]|jgi:flagellar assembly protein FliH|nr:flagellar assembly protein FliH [Treponema sp.]
MAKSIFHDSEIQKSFSLFPLPLMKRYAPPPDAPEEASPVEEIPEYTGPTADDLRREAELFRSSWDAEKAEMIAAAQDEADLILNKAREESALESESLKAGAEKVLSEAQAQAESLVSAAKTKADGLIHDAESKQKELENIAKNEGLEAGRQAGYEEGRHEADRLVERLHVILEKVYGEREAILSGAEQQVVDLVLLMARKVVKAISESQEEAVKENVLEALRKVKSRCDVIVRVNMADARLTTEHAREFIQAVENVQNLTVLEDTSIDRGAAWWRPTTAPSTPGLQASLRNWKRKSARSLR